MRHFNKFPVSARGGLMVVQRGKVPEHRLWRAILAFQPVADQIRQIEGNRQRRGGETDQFRVPLLEISTPLPNTITAAARPLGSRRK